MSRIIMKWKKIKKENVMIAFYVLIIFAGIFKSYTDEANSVTTFAMPVNKKVIVIDAGHGGWAPWR